MISAYGTIINRFATTRGTTLLRNPAFASRNINDLQLTPTPQLLKISQSTGQYRRERARIAELLIPILLLKLPGLILLPKRSA
jgi:hypothetical protein